MGTARETNETIIGTKDGVTRCYAIKRMTEEDRWSSEEITAMQGTPQQPSPSRVGLHIPTRLPTEVAPDGDPHGVAVGGDDGQEIPPATIPVTEPLIRRTPSTHKEIDKYGPTPGCVGCKAEMRGESTRRGHSDRCRRRIEEAMRNDEQDKKYRQRRLNNGTQYCQRNREIRGEEEYLSIGSGG